MMMQRYVGLLFLVVILFACNKQDSPYTLPPKGDSVLDSLDLGSDYNFQYFYNLRKHTVVHVSQVDMWDLSFESALGGNQVFINDGDGMAVYKTGVENFADFVEADLPTEITWELNKPRGGALSSAFGDWKSKPQVYVLRMNATGTDLRKLKIIQSTNYGFIIEIADINSATGIQVYVEKAPNSNFTYFNMGIMQTVSGVEPEPDIWDIQFTKYGYTFYDQIPHLPYIVSGVLLNPKGTMAVADSSQEFYSINEKILEQVSLSSNRDAIGFNWKSYNVDQGQYTVKSYMNFIIKTKEDDYYKLRFTDFYNTQGVKGNPSFEFNQIK